MVWKCWGYCYNKLNCVVLRLLELICGENVRVWLEPWTGKTCDYCKQSLMGHSVGSFGDKNVVKNVDIVDLAHEVSARSKDY